VAILDSNCKRTEIRDRDYKSRKALVVKWYGRSELAACSSKSFRDCKSIVASAKVRYLTALPYALLWNAR
jgi:hypothetical protein